MRKFLILPLALFFFAACSQNENIKQSNSAVKENFKRLAFETEGVTIDIPEGWEKNYMEGMYHDTKLSHKMHLLSPDCTEPETDCPDVILNVFHPENKTLDEIYEDHTAKMKDKLLLQKMLSKETININGIPAIVINYEGEKKADYIKGTMAFLKNDSTYIIVDAVRDSYHAKFQDNEDDRVMDIIRSVRKQQIAKN